MCKLFQLVLILLKCVMVYAIFWTAWTIKDARLILFRFFVLPIRDVGETHKRARVLAREECLLAEIALKSRRAETVDVKFVDVSVNLSGPPSTPAARARTNS